MEGIILNLLTGVVCGFFIFIWVVAIHWATYKLFGDKMWESESIAGIIFYPTAVTLLLIAIFVTLYYLGSFVNGFWR